MRRVVLIAAALLTIGANARAQVGSPNVVPGTAAFRNAVDGKTVWMTTTDGVRQKGRVIQVTGTDLIWSGKRTTPIPFSQIARIEKVSHRVRNSVLLGLAAGAGLQLLLTIQSYYPDESCLMATFLCAGGVALIGVGVGTGVGLVNHATRGDQDVIYDAQRRRLSTTVVPIVSPARKGIGIAVSWR